MDMGRDGPVLSFKSMKKPNWHYYNTKNCIWFRTLRQALGRMKIYWADLSELTCLTKTICGIMKSGENKSAENGFGEINPQ